MIIAEVAQGYEGRRLLGELLIRGAAEAGADAVKFQIVFADDVAVPGYRYYDWYRQLEMPEADWQALKQLAHERGLKFYTDLSGERALAMAARVRPDGVKIHAGNFFNHPLAGEALTRFPTVFVSTGGMELSEIEQFIRRHALAPGGGKAVFLFGFQADPTPVEQNGLARLPELVRRLEGFDVGFMDHTDGAGPDGLGVSLMALGEGVRIFEKHLTLDRALKLEDYASALEPARFAEYVAALRRLEPARGAAAVRTSESERAYRLKMVKKLLAARALPAGHVLSREDVVQKRLDAEGGGFCCDPDRVIGRPLAAAVAAGAPLRETDLGTPSERKLVAALACRVQGSRLYGKPLQLLDVREHVTILDHLIRLLKTHQPIREIVLGISEGIENTPFVETARRHGIPCIWGDPADVLQRLIQCGHAAQATDIFRVTTESPFIETGLLDVAWRRHVEHDNDVTSTDALPEGTHFELYKLSALEASHQRGGADERSELCNLYIRRHPDEFRIEVVEVPERWRRQDIRLTVDFPEDLVVCRRVYAALKHKAPQIPVADIIAFLDEQPELKALVAPHVVPKLIWARPPVGAAHA